MVNRFRTILPRLQSLSRANWSQEFRKGPSNSISSRAPVMSVNRLAAVTVVVVLLIGFKVGAGSTAGLPEATAPNVDSINSLTSRLEREHCSSSTCQAMNIIRDAINLQITGAAATVGRPRPIPANRDRQMSIRYHRLVERSLPLDRVTCSTGASLLSRYSKPGVESDIIVPVTLLDFGSRLDGRDINAHCVSTLLSALPSSPAAQIAIHNAHALCLGDKSATQRCVAIMR